MWITPDVALPPELLASQRDGRLVLFAGAGVSVDDPSGFPSFRQLVRMMAAEAGRELPPWVDDRPDEFLGELEQGGFALHDRVRSVLSDGDHQPNDYHVALLGLFREAEQIRVVTTNHDRMFSDAGEKLPSGGIREYFAPALPVGSDFNGVVYIHGSVLREPRHLVLTDRDFGRAYLTQGWATTFLREMYAQFDVLFIGYSHAEPVLQYLARGLSIPRQRYAIADGAQLPGAWERLGITPIPYPRVEGERAHGELRKAVVAWAERTRMGYEDHELRIRELVAAPPPLVRDDADYVRSALADEATARIFATHRCGVEWLEWMKDVAEFRALFALVQPGAASLELARWFAQHFVLAHPAEAQATVQELGPQLSPMMWFSIAHRVWTAEERPSPRVFGSWINVLLESANVSGDMGILEGLVTVCRWPEDASAAMALLWYLTEPIAEFRPAFGGEDKDLPGFTTHIRLRGSDWGLRNAWDVYFAPHLDELIDDLEVLARGQITRAHDRLKAAGSANDTWDPLSFFRPSVKTGTEGG